MREVALGGDRRAVREPLQQLAEIIRAPEMALQAPAPLRRDVERIHERAKERQLADLDREILKTRGAYALDREAQDFDVGRGPVRNAQALDARLQELARPVGLARLKAEGRPVIGEPNREFRRTCKMHAADGNGEIGAQAKLVARWIGEHEGTAADLLARTVEEGVGRLKDRRLHAHISVL